MRQRAFSLLELLIVIGIITVIVAVMIPALNAARQQAKSVVCQNNLVQLHAAMFMYATRNRTFPNFVDSTYLKNPPGDACYDRGDWWWFNVISDRPENGFDTSSNCWCPSRMVRSPYPKQNILLGNYGVNRSICADPLVTRSNPRRPLSINQIRRPSEVLLLCDAGYAVISWHYAKNPPVLSAFTPGENLAYIPGLTAVNSSRSLRPGTEKDAMNGRHLNKTVNIGFVDGHVERVYSKTLQVGDANNLPRIWKP